MVACAPACRLTLQKLAWFLPEPAYNFELHIFCGWLPHHMYKWHKKFLFCVINALPISFSVFHLLRNNEKSFLVHLLHTTTDFKELYFIFSSVISFPGWRLVVFSDGNYIIFMPVSILVLLISFLRWGLQLHTKLERWAQLYTIA